MREDNSLLRLFRAEDEVRRWTAEWENASGRMELAKVKQRAAYLISQYEPINSIGIDRKILLELLDFVTVHGDMERMKRNLSEPTP
jgi:hypothetical protein